MKNKSERPLIWKLVILGLVELGIVFLAVPHSWVMSVGESDRVSVVTWFGSGLEAKILSRASVWFKSAFIDTGIVAGINHFLFGQWDQNAANSFQLDDRGLSQWVSGRISTAWSAIYQGLYRVSEVATWLPYIIPVLIPLFADAWFRRQVNNWRFFSPSPAKHAVSVWTVYVSVIVFILFPLLPITFPAILPPLLLLILGAGVWVFASNLTKRF